MTHETLTFDDVELETGDTVRLTIDLGDKQGDLPPMEVRLRGDDWKPRATLVYEGTDYGTMWGARDYVEEDTHFATLQDENDNSTVLNIEVLD